MKKLLFLACTLAFGFYSADSSAQLFRLNLVSAGSLSAPEQAILEQALTEAEAEINADFPSTSDPDRLMKGMANSSVMAGKGIGSDYASNMDVFLIGGGVGIGADLEEDKEADSDVSGIGVQGGLILGTNLSWMDAEKILGLRTDKLNVYLNYFGYNLERDMGDGEASSLTAKMKSLGVHFRYDLVAGKGGSKLLKWGGLKVHTGYEYNTTQFALESTINETINEDVGTQTVSGTLTGSPVANIDVATQSIPLEISTDIQFLYFLSLYTGLGVDFNFGKAKGDGSLNAPPTTLNYSGAGTDPTVQAEANIEGTGSVDSILTRGFVGVQVNLPFTHFFAQVDKAFGNELIGASAGLRFAF
jgi:hypothetical protein